MLKITMRVRRSRLLVYSENEVGLYFGSTSSKVSVQKVVLSPFHCKPRQSGVSLESPLPENIPQVPGNRAEVGQSYDGRKAVSATLLDSQSSRDHLARRDFHQLWLDFLELGGYFPVPGTLN